MNIYLLYTIRLKIDGLINDSNRKIVFMEKLMRKKGDNSTNN